MTKEQAMLIQHMLESDVKIRDGASNWGPVKAKEDVIKLKKDITRVNNLRDLYCNDLLHTYIDWPLPDFLMYFEYAIKSDYQIEVLNYVERHIKKILDKLLDSLIVDAANEETEDTDDPALEESDDPEDTEYPETEESDEEPETEDPDLDEEPDEKKISFWLKEFEAKKKDPNIILKEFELNGSYECRLFDKNGECVAYRHAERGTMYARIVHIWIRGGCNLRYSSKALNGPYEIEIFNDLREKEKTNDGKICFKKITNSYDLPAYAGQIGRGNFGAEKRDQGRFRGNGLCSRKYFS